MQDTSVDAGHASGTRAHAPRALGRSGLFSPGIALGCYSMSQSYGARDDAESVAVIHRAIGQGVRFIDTADFYGWGHNEALVAKALAGGRRTQVILSSKFGYVRDATGRLQVCGRPDYARAACEASLQRLQTDCLDVYFLHRVDPVVPIEDTVGAMADLVQAGKIRHVGLCELSPATLRRAHAVHPITAVQAEYSLWTRDLEQGLLDVAQSLDVTVLAFSPLARGMLSGQLRSLDQMAADDVRRKYPRFSPQNFALNLALVDRFVALARALGHTPSQLALAWLLEKNPGMVALCGCDTLDFLAENLGALDIRVAPDVLQTLSALFAPGAVAGDRYHAAMMEMLRYA